MPKIVTTARITCRSPEAREKVFAAFHKICQYSQSNEPGVLRYLVTVPVSDTDNRSLYMIEEYASQSASDAHTKTPPVQDLIKLLTEGDVLAGPPEVWNSHNVYEKAMRPKVTVSSEPVVVLGVAEYRDGGVKSALEGWGKIIGTLQEQGVLGFAVGRAEGREEVRTVEVYGDRGCFEDVRSRISKVLENQASPENRVGGSVVVLRAIDGFFGKDAPASKL